MLRLTSLLFSSASFSWALCVCVCFFLFFYNWKSYKGWKNRTWKKELKKNKVNQLRKIKLTKRPTLLPIPLSQLMCCRNLCSWDLLHLALCLHLYFGTMWIFKFNIMLLIQYDTVICTILIKFDYKFFLNYFTWL